MLRSTLVTTMSRRTLIGTAAQRTLAISRHMSTSPRASAENSAKGKGMAAPDEAEVLFESAGHVQKYILNRPKKYNALNVGMLNLLRPHVIDWSKSPSRKILVGTGNGPAFCAGGDVRGVVEAAANPETLPEAVDFFKREFEVDYLLATVPHPYVVVMDGITMGGGVGLAAHASFRIATEKTQFAMPETKIGYCPDVGATFFLSRMDGELGTYLGLTGNSLKGRDVFEHGFATHFVPSRRIPALLERLASLDNPTYDMINDTIEECSQERDPDDPAPEFTGLKRVAVDTAFAHNSVEEILASLKNILETNDDPEIQEWAKSTLDALELRSPTSLKVALAAIRKGRELPLLDALQMELNIATAFCNGESPDFHTGVSAVLIHKTSARPAWSPATVGEVQDAYIQQGFFSKYSPENGSAPRITVPPEATSESIARTYSPMHFALPTEHEIRQMVDGSHSTSGSTVITREELVQAFDALRKGKLGVTEKVLEVSYRCCVEDVDKETGERWLRWKSPSL